MDNSFVVKSHDVSIDRDYINWLHEIKDRYRTSQIKAAIRINSEKLLFNWQLGRDLVMRKAEQRWGSGVVEQVALDLQREFPNSGFTTRNLFWMKQWYLFYSTDSVKLKQLVSQLQPILIKNKERLQQIGLEIEEKLLQTAAELDLSGDQKEKVNQVGSQLQLTGNQKIIKVNQVGSQFEGIPFPPIFAFVPWRHHVEIFTRCQTLLEAMFYIQKTVEESWSRSTLMNCLKANLYEKQKTVAVNNFDATLPAADSQLVKEITKDCYDFGFIKLQPQYDENDLQAELEKYIADFLLELGTGFAFVGRQKEIIVSGKLRHIDLLFYHIHLRRYVVIELKVVPFEPEFAGKLNFYVNAVNHLFKTDNEAPTIGLLICSEKDNTEVTYSFEGMTTPSGVASYDIVQIEELKKQLPTKEQIKACREKLEAELRKKKK